MGCSERGLGRHPPLVPVPRRRGGSQLRLPELLLLRRGIPGWHNEEDPGPGPGPCILRFSLSSSMVPVKSHSDPPTGLQPRFHLLPKRGWLRLPPTTSPASLGSRPLPCLLPFHSSTSLASVPAGPRLWTAFVPPGDTWRASPRSRVPRARARAPG